jgi:hypothetical protein
VPFRLEEGALGNEKQRMMEGFDLQLQDQDQDEAGRTARSAGPAENTELHHGKRSFIDAT